MPKSNQKDLEEYRHLMETLTTCSLSDTRLLACESQLLDRRGQLWPLEEEMVEGRFLDIREKLDEELTREMAINDLSPNLSSAEIPLTKSLLDSQVDMDISLCLLDKHPDSFPVDNERCTAAVDIIRQTLDKLATMKQARELMSQDGKLPFDPSSPFDWQTVVNITEALTISAQIDDRAKLAMRKRLQAIYKDTTTRDKLIK